MKKLILLLFAFGFAVQVLAQDSIKTSVFILDLGSPKNNSLTSKDISNKLVFPSRNLLAFELKNGNPYKYHYTINSNVISFFDDAKIDFLKNIIKKDSSISVKNDLVSADSVIYKSDSYSSKAASAFQILSQASKLNDIGIKPLIPNSKEDDETNILNAIKFLKDDAAEQNVEIDNYILQISAEDSLDKDSFIKKRDEFNKEYIKLIQYTENLNSDAMNFEEIEKEYSSHLKSLDLTAKEIKKELLKMFQLKFSNYLLPLDINGKNIDLVEITVQRTDVVTTNSTPEKYVYNIYVKGGLKIDISGGLFITSLMDREYETNDISVSDGTITLTKKIIFEKNKGSYDFGFGSMVNISLRSADWLRPALSIGALFTANQKFQILSGLGIILGKEERVIFHAGLTMGSVAEISSQFQADGKTPYDLGSTGQVSTTNKFKFGHFFGFTYNFGKTKTQTSAK